MGKPYSDLEKRAIAVLAGGGDPAASQDQELASYWKWRINPTAPSHNLPTASERSTGRKLDDIAITPFGIEMGENMLAKVTISKRSDEFYKPKYADLGIELIDGTGTEVAYRLGSFKPARVYARTGAATSAVTRTSRITGKKYKSYYQESDQGYSAPFGKKLATDTQAERQQEIKTEVQSINSAINLITFTPEKIKV
jgi:hypothetical protein